MSFKISDVAVVMQGEISDCVVFFSRSINNCRGFVSKTGEMYSIFLGVELLDMPNRKERI